MLDNGELDLLKADYCFQTTDRLAELCETNDTLGALPSNPSSQICSKFVGQIGGNFILLAPSMTDGCMEPARGHQDYNPMLEDGGRMAHLVQQY